MQFRLALIVLALSFTAHAQDPSQCASDKVRIGVITATMFSSVEALENLMLTPVMLHVWRVNPLYEIGHDETVAFVETLEVLALNAVAIYDCQPGSLATLALLQDAVRDQAANAKTRVEYTSRNPLEWVTNAYIHSTATRIETLITGAYGPLPPDVTVESSAPEVDALREVDWQAEWRKNETNLRQEDTDFWGDLVRASTTSR